MTVFPTVPCAAASPALLVEGLRAAVREQLPVALVVVSLHQRESDLRVVELLDVRTARLGRGDRFHLDDLQNDEGERKKQRVNGTQSRGHVSAIPYLDRVGTGTVTGGHVTVALRDGTANGQVTVLAVHVVRTGARIVTQPDAEVLHLQRRLLQDALHRDDLAGCLLELAQLTQEVPEARLGHDVVRGEDVHLEERRVLLLLRGQLAPDHLVFFQLKLHIGGGLVVRKAIMRKNGKSQRNGMDSFGSGGRSTTCYTAVTLR